MSFAPVSKLEVWRTLADGNELLVGLMAQNADGVFFQYDRAYLQAGHNLSPFSMDFSLDLQRAPKLPHGGLHGVFADSLPDGWGLLLMDRVFRQHGIQPSQVTAMDRLAFIGDSGMGALSYRPVSDYRGSQKDSLSLQSLGYEAQAVFDGQTSDVLATLAAAGSSGGARPKAQVYFSGNDFSHCRTWPQSNQSYMGDEAGSDNAWLVKFTSNNLPLKHEEGRCEAAYLTIAASAGLQVPEWRLVDGIDGQQWLAIKRFDYLNQPGSQAGRLHMHSACGLLDADFRSPSLDYEDLIKASSMLCKSPRAGQLQFKRAMFNLFACNQDDHSKNWAFLQDDAGDWQIAPFYDVTYSPHPLGEHATALAGYGKNPTLKAVQKLASTANYAQWRHAQQAIEEVVSALATFAEVAVQLGVKRQVVTDMQKGLNAAWKCNRQLLVG